MERHKIFGGRLQVYKRGTGKIWQCYTFLNGQHFRNTTREDSLALAKQFAEDWYLTLRGKLNAGELKNKDTEFRTAAEQFLREFPVITEGHRSPKYIERLKIAINIHLIPFFEGKGLSQITAGTAQEYRIHRIQTSRTGRPPARSTIHHEIVALRQILKTAHRHKWIDHVPDLSPPYKTSGKIAHRAWFSPTEYRQLYVATRERARNPLRRGWTHRYEEMHDYVLFMANTGLRPDEARRLEFRDVTITKDRATKQTILEIEVRGKRGVGHCKSMPGAVLPYKRLRKRKNPKPTDLVFRWNPRDLLNIILAELELKVDRDNNPRTAYSLRHTYICFRLMEGADIYQIAKNCRTSVEMIEKYYAKHLKNTLDASLINVIKPKK